MTSNNSSQALQTSLLRPSVLHILRAAGFQSTKPAVLDTVIDLTARYLTALAEKVAVYSSEGSAIAEPTVTHVRLAMEDIGVFVPRSTAGEEVWSTTEDLRGVQAFIDWCKGEANTEIRRIAGMTTKEGAKVEVGGLGDGEDFLSGTEDVLLQLECS
jgi:transcription initiation factor TFIID subunit 3